MSLVLLGGLAAEASPVPAQQPLVLTEAAVRPDSLLAQAAGRARWRLNEVISPDTSIALPYTPDGVKVVTPAVITVWNSDLPYSGNDGPLWAGRGLSLGVSGGVTLRTRRKQTTFDASLVPVVTYAANQPFQIFPGADRTRSSFSSPWHVGGTSADLPLRFGSAPRLVLDPGETNLRVTARGVSVGIGTRSRWWGPGVRNALVLSNNAPAIPQLFAETARPAATSIGAVSATLMVGTLNESVFFDTATANDHRSVSGLLLELQPSRVPGLSIGLARLVMRPVASREGSLARAFDALLTWERRASAADTLEDGRTLQRSDQLTSLFARWIFPQSGFEVYGEWARTELPKSLHELAVTPHNTQGYTLGAQWIFPTWRAPGRFRLHTEVTYLEQSIVLPERPPAPFYTGRATVHGFTQRGQVLGAAIGPGGSSQLVGGDYVGDRWQAGAFVGRTRWDNDVLYRQSERFITRHDVTIYSGLGGAVHHRRGDITGELTVGKRLNYLFQNEAYNPGPPVFAVDIRNVTLSLAVTPR